VPSWPRTLVLADAFSRANADPSRHPKVTVTKSVNEAIALFLDILMALRYWWKYTSPNRVGF